MRWGEPRTYTPLTKDFVNNSSNEQTKCSNDGQHQTMPTPQKKRRSELNKNTKCHLSHSNKLRTPYPTDTTMAEPSTESNWETRW